MTSYPTGFLYLSDSFGNAAEVVNEARTANLLASADLPEFSDVNEDICPALNYEPCVMADDGTVTDWTLADLSAENAPWYDSTSQASLEGFGFYIEEWTGLDGAHHTRETIPRGSRFGGVLHALPSDGGRVMAVNLVAVGSTERGLNHLMRWLETVLLRSCDPTATASLWGREFCPEGTTDGDLEEGLFRADEVGMVAGPTWVDPPVDDAGCRLRRLSFTLTAGDPCLYRPPADLTSEDDCDITSFTAGGAPSSTWASCSEYSGETVQVVGTVDLPTYGVTSPVVRITSTPHYVSGVRTTLPALRIFGIIDVHGTGVADPCNMQRTGLIVLDGITSGVEVLVDCGNGLVLARDLYGDADWADGSQFLQPANQYDDTFVGRRAITFTQCSGAYVVVEPARPNAWSNDWVNVDDAAETYSVDIQTVDRFGCV